MPSEEAYQAVLAKLQELTDAWRIHREVVNRAISYLNEEVVTFQARLDADDKARVSRQTEIDAKLDAITQGQASIRRWQFVRIGVEIAAVLVVIAFLWGRAL